MISQLLFCILMLGTSIEVVFFTGYSITIETNGAEFLEYQHFWTLDSLYGARKILFSIVASIVGLLTLWFLYKKNFFSFKPKIFVTVSVVFLLGFQIVWILSLGSKSNIFPDSQALRIIADYLNTGSFTPSPIYQTEQELFDYM